ncbi:MAG TPA: response regulator [bacterium]|jgi:DNA-binding response OmpR family regulator|nr:response regulator [bacterium]HOG38555.1 response regulator [bacterium]HQI03443.1 response regulator [bacterium]
MERPGIENNESKIEKEKLKKILIIDDDVNFQKILDLTVKDRGYLLHAYTLEQAEQILGENQDIDIIFLDGCLNNSAELDTVPFVKLAREMGFNKEIIAMSSDDKFNNILLESGCDKKCDKFDMIPEILNIINSGDMK